MRREVKMIQLHRAEGPMEDGVGRWLDLPTFAAANAQLARWAQTAPPEGRGYDKCDFRVLYRDGEDPYEGRFDLTREHISGGRLLQEHIESFVLWYFGLHYRDRETGELVKV